MSLLISHRGNINGMKPSLENSPEHVQAALDKGFHVLVDVWIVGDKYLAFGIDFPQYSVELSYLKENKIICRAHNIDTLDFLLSNEVHCFLLSNDDYIMTNGGLIWAHSRTMTKRCVLHMPEHLFPDFNHLAIPSNELPCVGICSDYIADILSLRDAKETSNKTNDVESSNEHEDVILIEVPKDPWKKCL